MRRGVVLFAVGIAVGVAATAALFLLRHNASWQEQEARSQADTLACNIGQVGLGVRPCAELLSFRTTAPYTWEARIGTTERTYCFRLHTFQSPRRCNART